MSCVDEYFYLERTGSFPNRGGPRFTMHNLTVQQLRIMRDLLNTRSIANNARMNSGMLSQLQRTDLALEELQIRQLTKQLNRLPDEALPNANG